MLTTARDERRRADDEAAAVRERLDQEAAVRRALLLAEVAELDARHGLDAVPAPREVPAGPTAADADGHGGRWRGHGRSGVLHLPRRRG